MPKPSLDPAYSVVARMLYAPDGVTVEQLMDAVSVDKRSVYRYLASIKARYPVERITKRGQPPRYRMLRER